MKTGEWSLADGPSEGSVDESVVPRGPRTGRREDEPLPPRPPMKFVVPPTHGFTPVQARERRRKRQDVQYDSFDLAAEVEAICGPLAAGVSGVLTGVPLLRDTEKGGLALRFEVEVLAAAVHELRTGVVELLAGDRQLSAGGRARVASTAVAASVRELTDDELRAGSWVHVLVAHVAPLSADLASLLGRSPASFGSVSPASDRLRVVLEPFDQAAGDLERRIPKVRQRQEFLASVPAIRAEEQAERQRAHAAHELTRLGLR